MVLRKILILVPLILLYSNCNKKKEPLAEPVVATPKQQLKVKINGSETTCNTCFSSYYSSGIWGINFYIPGNANGDRFVINFSKRPAIGTYTLVKFGEPSFNYQNDNTYFRGRGIITITAIDTSVNRAVNKLAATFSCTTDTSFNRTYIITEGEINVNTQ
jgi:hypothetical protein